MSQDSIDTITKAKALSPRNTKSFPDSDIDHSSVVTSLDVEENNTSKESKKRNRRLNVTEADIKPKTVRISERLSIKRKRANSYADVDFESPKASRKTSKTSENLLSPSLSKRARLENNFLSPTRSKSYNLQHRPFTPIKKSPDQKHGKGSLKQNSFQKVQKEKKVDQPIEISIKAKRAQRGKIKKKGKYFWTAQDLKIFFRSLGEFGRDFDAIIDKTVFRRNPEIDRNQVRYLYYRLWSKISKFIHLKNSDVRPAVLELYGLINYGALRECLHNFAEKHEHFGKYLNELIFKGETKVKVDKRKNVLIRTPNCYILKRLNRINDRKKKQGPEQPNTPTLPFDITLELTPKTTKAWAKVQSMSQNPRLKIQLTANRTLQSVFTFLQGKWKSRRQQIRASLDIQDDCLNEELVCYLHPNSKIEPVILKPNKFVEEKRDISLNNYIERILPTLSLKKTSKSKDPEVKPENQTTDEAGAVKDKHRNSEILPENNDNSKTISKEHALPVTLLGVSVDGHESSSIKATKLCNSENRKDNISKYNSAIQKPSVLMDDDNAMFPDSNVFSPSVPQVESKSSISGLEVEKSLTSSQTEATDASSYSGSDVSSIVTPSVEENSKNKTGNIKKLPVGSDKSSNSLKQVTVEKLGTQTTDSSTNETNQNSMSPSKDEEDIIQDIEENSEKEMERISSIAQNGITATTASTISLLQLSILLGRQSTIYLEYEWQPIKKPTVQQPMFFESANQITNVLRRLCNIAALELAEIRSAKCKTQNSSEVKTTQATESIDTPEALCSHCGAPRNSSKLGAGKKKREEKIKSKEISDASASSTVSTFVVGPSSGGNTLPETPDPVFRVPQAPIPRTSYKEDIQHVVPSKNTYSLNKITSRRKLTPKSRPIIVKRTLLPKGSADNVINIIPQNNLHGQSKLLIVDPTFNNAGSDMSSNTSTSLIPILSSSIYTHPPVNLSGIQSSGIVPKLTSSTESTTVTPSSNTSICIPNLNNESSQGIILPSSQPMDILSTAIRSAQINFSGSVSPEKQAPGYQSNIVNPTSPPIECSIPTLSTSSPHFKHFALSLPSPNVSPLKINPVVFNHGDTSLSDFNISMNSMNSSSMGPDAGDKFLDLVLQNSEQGFSGLIEKTEPVCETEQVKEPSTASSLVPFDASVLRTPPHFDSTVYAKPSTASIYPSPVKLSTDQIWINSDSTDASLSSVLDLSSHFRKRNEDSEKISPTMNSLNSHFIGDNSNDVLNPLPALLIKPENESSGNIFSSVLNLSSSYHKDIEKEGKLIEKVSPPITSLALNNSFLQENSNEMFEPSSALNIKPQIISDISLGSLIEDSSFGGKKYESLVSPSKMTTGQDSSSGQPGNPEHPLFNEASSDSFGKLDVDCALQGVVNDSSLDLVSKFESLAAQIADKQEQEIRSEKQAASN